MKKIYVQLCVVFAVVGVVAGCSSGGSDTSSSSASTAGSTVPPGDRKPKGAPVTTSMDGATIFAQSCAGCHGEKGVGGKKPPALAGRRLAVDDVAKIVQTGKGRMPAFGSKFKKEQIDALAKYVNTL